MVEMAIMVVAVETAVVEATAIVLRWIPSSLYGIFLSKSQSSSFACACSNTYEL